MKTFSDKTQRQVSVLIEYYDIVNFIHRTLRENGYEFKSNEIELNFKFIEEGSPPYKTGKIECSVKMVKDVVI